MKDHFDEHLRLKDIEDVTEFQTSDNDKEPSLNNQKSAATNMLSTRLE